MPQKLVETMLFEKPNIKKIFQFKSIVLFSLHANIVRQQ